jgi:hypothetical protein
MGNDGKETPFELEEALEQYWAECSPSTKRTPLLNCEDPFTLPPHEHHRGLQ